MAEFSSSSQRSRRNVVSPIERMKAVSPAGPPNSFSNKLAAALSLYCTAAADSSATVMPVVRYFSEMGDHGTSAFLP